MNVYPNPFTESATIEFSIPQNEVCDIMLTDVTGVKLQEFRHLESGTITIDRKGLSTGIFFVHLIGENGLKFHQKVIIQ